MAKVFRRAVARRDLVEHFVYLAEKAGLEVAERFLANAAAGFKMLGPIKRYFLPTDPNYGALRIKPVWLFD